MCKIKYIPWPPGAHNLMRNKETYDHGLTQSVILKYVRVMSGTQRKNTWPILGKVGQEKEEKVIHESNFKAIIRVSPTKFDKGGIFHRLRDRLAFGFQVLSPTLRDIKLSMKRELNNGLSHMVAQCKSYW